MSFLPAKAYQITKKIILRTSTYQVHMHCSSLLKGGEFDEKIAIFDISEPNFERFLIEHALFTLYQDKYAKEFTQFIISTISVKGQNLQRGLPWSWLYDIPVETEDWPMNFDDDSKNYKLMLFNGYTSFSYYDEGGNKFDVGVNSEVIKNHVVTHLGRDLSFNQIVKNLDILIEKLSVGNSVPTPTALEQAAPTNASKMKV